MRVIPRIFVFDDEDIPPELRAQRTLNRNRIPDIARYFVDNREGYIVSALTASVDASVKFEPSNTKGAHRMMGTLHIPMDAHLLINDGQHRRAAIEAAVKECPDLANDNVPVLFFIDKGLKRSQQMFADLNKHAIRPSESLSTLYDHRDPCSELARFVAMSVDGFKGMTEMEKSSISNRSMKLFTLSGIKKASSALLRKKKNDDVSKREKQLACRFWDEVVKNIPDWGQAKERKITAGELRQGFIHAHGVALSALGLAGADLLAAHPKDWARRLRKLRGLDWSRSNQELWEGRAMVLGKISKATNHVQLTANLIKQQLGLPLSLEEDELERQLEGRNE